jgi:hypothetical protein
MLETWTAAVQASGPVQVHELWNDMKNDPHVWQTLNQEGVTDDLWATISETMKKLEGRVFVERSKLAAEVKAVGQNRTHNAVFNRSDAERPKTVSELLRRAELKRILEKFGQRGSHPLSLAVISNEPHAVEFVEIVLTGSAASLQMLAEHTRKLEDMELATYTGNEPTTILVVMFIGLVVFLIGWAIMKAACKKNYDGTTYDETGCTIGQILAFLGLMVMTWGFAGLVHDHPTVFGKVMINEDTGTTPN